MIQLHVPHPVSPSGATEGAEVRVPAPALAAPDVIDQVTSPPAWVLFPLEKRSLARSKWISIGRADRRPEGERLVRFLFGGIDPMTGRIETSGDGTTVADRPALVTVDDLAASPAARILSDGLTLELRGAALPEVRGGATAGISNDLYLRNPALLEDCVVRVSSVDSPALFAEFAVAEAVYDERGPARGDEVLRVTVGPERGFLTDFDPGAGGATRLELLPRFFRILSGGVANAIPATARVSVRFQAAADDGSGAPDERELLQDWLRHLALSSSCPRARCSSSATRSSIDLDTDLDGRPADVTSLDFLRIPFVF